MRVVLSRLVDSEGAPGPMPACDTLANQACRPSPAPPPAGELALVLEAGNWVSPHGILRPWPPPTRMLPPPLPTPRERPLPATGGGMGTAVLALAAIGARRRERHTLVRTS